MENLSNLSEAKIYVGTYGKYNGGSIQGEWLELSDYSTKDDFYAACAELHEDEEDPEYMFQDWENIPDSLISESWISDNIFEIIEALEDFDSDRGDAFSIWCNRSGNDISKEDIIDLIANFEDDYCGFYSGHNPMGDYTAEIVDEMMPSDAPDFLKNYFDYEKFERDLFSCDYWEEDGHIFRNR